MKKPLKLLAGILFLFLFFFVILPPLLHSLFTPEDPVLASLPKFQNKEFYSCNGFQDTTDYAKYTYRLSESVFADHPYFQKITQRDIPEILAYIEDFEGWVETCSDFPSESYDFTQSSITQGDYFCILNRYEEPDKKYWNYNVYFFDLDTQTLFYFHSNI